MVTRKTFGDKTVYFCDVCELGYEARETAQQCEDWCKKHPGSCNMQISIKAIYFRDTPIPKLPPK